MHSANKLILLEEVKDKLEAARLQIQYLELKLERKDDFITTIATEFERVETKLLKYREALESIAANTCCGPCQEARKVAALALTEKESTK